MYWVDSREKEGKNQHILDYFDQHGILWEKKKLDVGDYQLEGHPEITVDRKANMNEVESNLIHDHKRFVRELERAKDHGQRLIVLVEGFAFTSLDEVAAWNNPRWVRWMQLKHAQEQGKFLHVKISRQPPANGAVLAKIMQTMSDKYGVEWQFCRKSKTGERIWSILTCEKQPTKSSGKSPAVSSENGSDCVQTETAS